MTNSKKLKWVIILLLALLPFLLPLGANAGRRWCFEVETGAAFNGQNDIAIPGDTGTRFSLTESFDVKPTVFYRLRLTYALGGRHQISALLAPLRFRASGPASLPIHFFGADFAAGAPIDATYRFNSYRLTYRYGLVDSEKWKVGIGFTAKIRDAAIRLESGSARPQKTNIGFVPLLHFRVEHVLSTRAALLLEGDALAAPQGRAEDVLLAFLYKISGALTLKAGYRVVEGGADNKAVYNFALIHYASVGLLFNF
jgi:hypothetical protein